MRAFEARGVLKLLSAAGIDISAVPSARVGPLSGLHRQTFMKQQQHQRYYSRNAGALSHVTGCNYSSSSARRLNPSPPRRIHMTVGSSICTYRMHLDDIKYEVKIFPFLSSFCGVAVGPTEIDYSRGSDGPHLMVMLLFTARAEFGETRS